MDFRQLVSIELRFTTDQDPEQTSDRVKEAVRMIVGSDALEDFRVRHLPLEPPADKRRRRSPEV